MGKITLSGKRAYLLVIFTFLNTYSGNSFILNNDDFFSEPGEICYLFNEAPKLEDYQKVGIFSSYSSYSDNYIKAAGISISGTLTNVLCSGESNGAIDITINGGVAPYTYSWSGPGSFSSMTEDINNLGAGSYAIIVKDYNNDTASSSFTISEPAPLQILSPSSTDVNCNGQSDGSVTAGSVSGGTSPYQYQLNSGAFGNSNSFTGLSAGNYTITVQDQNGCIISQSATINQPAVLTMQAPTATPVNCNGQSDGTITAGAVSGGNTTYQYSIDGTTFQTSNSFTRLAAKTYTVTVKDDKGCSANSNIVVTQPAVLTMQVATATPVSCNGQSDGTITAGAVSGGNSNYQYSIDGTTFQTSNSFTGLAANNYTVTVKDDKGCTSNVTITINQPPVLTMAAPATTPVSCKGGSDGTITAGAVSGGNSGYTYSINGTNFKSSNSFSGFSAGTYTVTLKDTKGCTTTAPVTITEPAILNAIVSFTNITCNSANDGTISITSASGGYGTYQYSINNGTSWQDSGNYTRLSNGTYPILIRDKANANCVVSLDPHLEISRPFTLNGDVSGQNVSCNGGTNGSITISNSSGGYDQYEYSIDGINWQADETFSNLKMGTYQVQFRDAINTTCVIVLNPSFLISEPQVLTAKIDSKTDVLCNGLATGAVTASATGGTAPYTYSWGSIGPGATKTNLPAGTYSVTVTDAKGCVTAPLSVNIIEPATFIQIASTKTTSGCFQQNNGTAYVAATGGTGSYRYLWSNGQTTQTATGLAPGTHSVSITDQNGCSKSTNVTVSNPTQLQITGFLTTETTSWGSATGTATAQVSGGSPNYIFRWTGPGSYNQTGQTARNLLAGIYTVTVTDANGCTATKEVLIIDTLAAEVIPTSVCKTEGDITRTSYFSIENKTAKGGTAPYTYQWNFGAGATPSTATGPGSHEVKYSTIGEKTISVKITDSKGLTLTKTIIQYVGGCFVADCGSNDLGVDNYFIGDGNGNLITSTNCSDSAQKYLYIILPTQPDRYSLYVEYIYSIKNLQTGTTENLRKFGCFYPKTTIPDIAQTIPINYTCGDFVKIEGIYLTFSNNKQWGCGEGPKPKCYSTNNEASVRSPLYAVAFPNQLLCNGATDGRITARASGGTAPYLYNLNGGTYGTANEFKDLAAGVYTVKVKDATGEIFTVQTEITQPTNPLVLNLASKTPISCFGGNNGTATVRASGGTPNSSGDPYIYVWENGQTTATATNLTAGNYNVRVIDANGCEVSLVVPIEQPAELLAVTGPDQILACGTTSTSLQADFQYTAAEGEEVKTGLWTIINGPTGGSFTDATNPTTQFTGTPGTYTLKWTVPCGASDDVKISIANCSTIDFDGINDHIDFGNNFNLPANFTLEAWVKQDATTSSGIKTILSKRNSANLNKGGYDLIVENNIPKFRWNGSSIVSQFPIGTDRWYHIAVIKGGVNEGLYVDGIKVSAEGNSPGFPTSLDKPFIIGAIYNSTTPITPEKYFHGWIEEVRIWSTALNLEQLRFMMNQRIQNNAGNVKGVEIPLNTPGDLKWTSLSGYYQMEKVQNGYTLGEVAGSSNGKLINITTLQQRTAPLPYISNKAGQWFADETWLRPQVWDPPASLGIDASTVIKWNIARISHNINSGGKNIRVLGLLSKSGKLTMANPNESLNEKNSGQSLTITHYMQLNGIIDLVGESQLIQTDIADSESKQTIVSVLDESSTGYIERDQQGTANSYNYNYWSSPVSLQKSRNNSTFTIASVVMDGTNSNSPKELSFDDYYGYADGPYSTPRKISNYWLWKFRGTANVYSEWEQIGSTGNLNAGEGFTMKGTSGYAKIEDRQNYVFKGKPNNGNINLTIATDQNYLLGNPYPSAISVEDFILDNLKDVAGGRNTSNIFNGALYFWDHFAGGDTHILVEYIGGYATRNLIAGVPAISNDYRILANDAKGNKIPGPYIPVGQGFFINSTLDSISSPDISVDGGNIQFKNSQRAFVKESNANTGNSVFLRPEDHTKESEKTDTRAKIRLDFKSPLGYHRQILVGVDENTTNGFDLGYDAPLNDDNQEDMFWMIEDMRFVIQGVSNINPEQVLPIGVKIKEEGEIIIEINDLENIPDDVNIYLLDNTDSTYHDLIKNKFNLKVTPGEHLKRFEIVFQDKSSTNETSEEESSTDVDENTDTGETTSEETDENTDSSEDTNSSTEETATVKPGEENEEDNGGEIPKDFSKGEVDIIYVANDHELALWNPKLKKVQRIEIYNMNGQKVQLINEVPLVKESRFPVSNFAQAIYVIKVYLENKIIIKNIIVK